MFANGLFVLGIYACGMPSWCETGERKQNELFGFAHCDERKYYVPDDYKSDTGNQPCEAA